MAAVKGLYGSIDEFLKHCSQSGDSAYSAFRSLLERLEDPKTRTEARIFFAHLKKKLESDGASDQCLDTYHFQIQDVYLGQNEGYQKRNKLTMMVIPSIFMPEDWSFTFYEGLNRHPDTIFKDKIVAELGCGNGWISIAIAERWLPSKVYGLDINPRAVKISWINLYLNAFDENGEPIYDHEKKTLLDRVEFYESDLLSYCRDNHIELERIVGCIPQILNPNPDAMSKLITENASEDFLYSLSNYCALQGFVEDQFGLGLIARAVEEGIEVMKPMGIMIFNIGGRPGQAVCKRLFQRRGLIVTQLWQTKILQASDTDISALVEIEKKNPHRFEFFMGLVGDQPICARTAWAFGKAGGRISHALSVYSCQLRQPNQVKKIFEFLKNGFQDISNSLDLSFEDDSVADEKIPFLAYLASVLKDDSHFPYEPPSGSKRFRNLIAGFMKTYHHVPITADNVVVFPSRATAIENALQLFTPRLAIVDDHLSRHLPRQWLTSLQMEHNENDNSCASGITVIEAPRQSDLMIELIKKLRPQVVVTGMAEFEAVTSSAFEHILMTTMEIGARLFIDISDQFELSSLPSSNGVLKYLARTPLPPHAAIICGLLKNQVYKDLEVAFVISEEPTICKALSKSVELLQGNIALISQYYYGCLFNELLSFQLPDRHPPAERESNDAKSSEMIGFSTSAILVLTNSEFSITETENSPLIHMDVDQIFLPTPTPVKSAIFESFARQNVTESECDTTPSLKTFIKTAYGFSTNHNSEFIYADCPQAIFTKLVLTCIQENATLCLPTGSNGNYISVAKFLNAKIMPVVTKPENHFKMTQDQLSDVLENVSKPWVYIAGPTVNPTGLIYSNEEIGNLLTVCAKYGARVIIDTSFSGVEFEQNYGLKEWDLDGSLVKLISGKPSFNVCLLGGLFFKMVSGGITFGFLVVDRRFWGDGIYNFSGLSKPHSTIRYTAKKLLDLREQKAGDLLDATQGQWKLLSGRFKQLKETLEGCGWEVVEACGGVSIVAKPSAYIGKKLELSQHNSSCSWKAVLNDSNIREAMVRATGLCINGPSWTGIPGYFRFTLALQDTDFNRALECIIKFNELVNF